jgi:methylated-DNA-protein-cysteine methyltransferase-like protein
MCGGYPIAMAAPTKTYQRIYAVVRRIPRGRVTTYGTVARLAGLPGQARLVGYALSALPTGTAVPWHRVINARGEVSLRTSASGAGLTQHILLERERVVFDAAGRVKFERFGWKTAKERRV